MHPRGIEYGLSQDLLQLVGDQVLLSDKLIEQISTASQVRFNARKPPIDGNFMVDMTVRAAEDLIVNRDPHHRPEIAAFFGGINRTMYFTLCRVAERAHIGQKEPDKFITTPEFWREFSEGVVDIQMKPAKSIPKLQRALFKVCYDTVYEWYLEHDPFNARFTAMTTFFMFNFWNAIGLLPMTQSMLILHADL